MNIVDPTDTNLIDMVKNSMENFINVYRKFNPYDYIILKSVILRFLQGKNVKVSIFIQENLQDSSSIIYLPMNEESPPFFEKVGIVKNKIKNKEEFFELKLSNCYKENKNNDRMDNFSTDFGKNMFGTKSLNFIGRIKKKSKENETNKNEKNFNKTYEIKNPVYAENYYGNKELSSEQKKIISQGNKKDLNLFSSVFAENEYEDNNDDIFEFDLFGNDEQFLFKIGEMPTEFEGTLSEDTDFRELEGDIYYQAKAGVKKRLEAKNGKENH